MEGIQNQGNCSETPTQHLKTSVEELKGTVKDAGKMVYDSAKKTAIDVAETGKSVATPYAEEGKKQLLAIEGYLREHPIKSVLMGVAGGALLSRMFRN